MSTITVKDGSTIYYYKDWGPRNAQPIVFHHGWPLSADDWDTQMLYFCNIAHDRRGYGLSSQVSDGHDMDHYAADAPRSSLISICATRSTSATRLAAAKRRATSRATARAVSPSWSSSAPCRRSW